VVAVGSVGIVARRLTVVVVVAVAGLLPAGLAHAGPPVPGPVVSFGMTGGDYVHISSTPPRSASAHGWWTYPTKTEQVADVSVQLQVRRGGTWVDVGVAGVERVRSGGGSANRSNARVTCLTTADTEWRSVVDVDVVGRWDNPGKLVTPARRLGCGV
jgi:hypothetical protein